ncbi:hypothetical protein BH20ACT24_BH20ACT24_14920 [soil metagenome]
MALGFLAAQLLVLGIGGVLRAAGSDPVDLVQNDDAPSQGSAGIGTARAAPAGAQPGAGALGAGEAGPHHLRIVSTPEGASVRIEGPDGSTSKGRTPFDGEVASGDVTVSLSLAGHNPLTETFGLDRDRTIQLWLDPEGLLHHQMGAFDTGVQPKQVAFSPDGTELWVTPLGEPGIEVYDAATFRLLGEIETGDYGSVEVTFTRDGSTAYVSQMQTASVFEIDVATRTVRRQLFTKSAWSKIMALSPDERTLYVANWSGDNVTEFDLGTGQVRRQIPCVDTPRGLYVTEDGEGLFVAGFGDGELQRIDLHDGASEILLRTGGALRHLVADPEAGLLYADDMATDEVFVVDLTTEEARKLADTDSTPNTIDLTPDGRVLYVSNRGANGPDLAVPGPEWGSVLAIDTATGEVLDAMVAGNRTTGLDVSPDGSFLAYTDFLDNRVSVFAIPEYAMLANGSGGRADEYVQEIVK